MGTQAQAVGAPRLYAGLLGRADRVVLSMIFPIIQFIWIWLGNDIHMDVFGYFTITWLEIMMVWFAVIGNLTAVQRAIVTWNNMKKMKEE